MSNISASSVQNYDEELGNLLQYADSIKQGTEVDPALTEADLGERFKQSKRAIWDQKPISQASYAALETYFRQEFYKAVAANSINDPDFVRTWNLLDVVQVCGDNGLCEPALLCWLAEELLDSQTIDGCRKVFDYLESRRERIIAKNFNSKNLVILRACNELLRRLSRAEDTVFCGRVFIFLFQSFPLGDKSSVNLRGEFHVENITAFDSSPEALLSNGNNTHIDGSAGNSSIAVTANDSSFQPVHPTGEEGKGYSGKTVSPPSASLKPSENSPAPDLYALYPIFWGLQAYLSAPTELFFPEPMAKFKFGLETTLSSFQQVRSNVTTSGKQPDDAKRSIKRKSSDGDSESTGTFHPKYLTNRDLFELEIHDLAFRRHILVQALILLDFLLSLTPSAKMKFTGLTNKSVLYPQYTLSEEDAGWAIKMKSNIVEYLQQGVGNEGKFYHRMVDTVLSRDKNWGRWKAENCPPIQRPSISAEQYLQTQQNLKKRCTNETLSAPKNTMNMDFLSKDTSLNSLKDSARYSTPTSESFLKGIEMDDLDAEMGTEEEMRVAKEAKDSKIWRALRASRNRFRLCEKIDNGRNLKALSEQSAEPTIAESGEVENLQQEHLEAESISAGAEAT